MKICIVGPGYMPIPPKGWGAVESLIWDYNIFLKKKGYDVQIVNNSNPNEIIKEVNNSDADIIHIQYDDWVFLSTYMNKPVVITSHYAYLEQPEKHGNYSKIFQSFIDTKSYVFALSKGIKDTYVKFGLNKDNVFVVPNGVDRNKFEFNDIPEDKSIYLAKIDYRKRQYLYHNIDDLYFAGNIADDRYNRNNYLGEWSKEYLYKNLTNYANLVLLSDGEAHPLVCMEALSAGLGLVISEYASANLDDKPFIDIISREKMNDIDYVSKVIKHNREKSIKYRNEIREYSSKFDWLNVIEKYYIPYINKIKESYEK